MTNHKLYIGSVFDALEILPSKHVNTVVTSPPYYGLRNYGIESEVIWDENSVCIHDWKSKKIKWHPDRGKYNRNRRKEVFDDSFQVNGSSSSFCSKCGAWKGALGLEPTVDLYINHLCDIFDEIKRVLRGDGTCFVNLGDSYFNKSLAMIPFRFALEMSSRGWFLRNTIIWHKPNCMPSSASDRFTVDFEYLFFFSKNKEYYLEQQFEEYTHPLNRWGGIYTDGVVSTSKYLKENIDPAQITKRSRKIRPNDSGRNKRCVWNINTTSFLDAHFAVYPEELIKIPIKAGCPEFICNNCGKPRIRIYQSDTSFHSGSGKSGNSPKGKHDGKSQSISGDYDIRMGPRVNRNFIGYSDCGCGAGFHSGIVLDPFLGSGTTMSVAKYLNRDSIGIEVQPNYLPMILKRTGLSTADMWKKVNVDPIHSLEIINL